MKDLLHKSRIFKLGRLRRRNDFIIFNYHRLRNVNHSSRFDDGVFGPDSERFRMEMQWLKKETTILSEQDLLQAMTSGEAPSSRTCSMVTFDDGYRDNYDLAFPILKELKIPATFFIPSLMIEQRELGWWDHAAYLIKESRRSSIAFAGQVLNFGENRAAAIKNVIAYLKTIPASEMQNTLARLSQYCEVQPPSLEIKSAELMTWSHIREMAQTGMTIGSHSHTHQVLANQTDQEVRYELETSKKFLQEKLGQEIRSLAYPVGGPDHYNETVKKIARETGYQLAFSYLTGINQFQAIDQFDIRRVGIQAHWHNLDYALAFPDLAYRDLLGKKKDLA